MGLLSLNLPVIGQSSATEDQKVRDALNAIQTDYNGNLTDANIAVAAGIAGTKLAAKSVDRDRLKQPIIAGRVETTGTIIAGTGFAITKTGTGAYTITFDAGFTPVVVVASGANQVNVIAAAGNVTGQTVPVTVYVASTGAASDQRWAFIAYCS